MESAPKIRKNRIIISHARKTDAVDTLTHLATNDLRRKIHRKLINKLNGGRKEAKMSKYESKESKTDEAMEENKLIDSFTETDTNAYIQEFQRVEMDDNIHDTGNELNKKQETLSQVDILSTIIEQKRRLSRENSRPDRLKRKTHAHVRVMPSDNETEKEIADIGKQSDSESVCSELSAQSTLPRHTDCKIKITTLVKTSDDEPLVRTRQRCEIVPPGGNKRKRTLSGEFHLLDEFKLRKNQRNSDIVSDNEIQTQTTCTLMADDLLKHCKPCSVLLIDLFKQFQINQQKMSETGSESEALENERSTDVDIKKSYAYKENFLKFIKDKELQENDGIPKLASAPVSAKSVNQTADGKVYNAQANGSLTVSASGDAATSTCTSKSDTGLNEAAIVAQKKKAENAGKIMESCAKFREKIMKEIVGMLEHTKLNHANDVKYICPLCEKVYVEKEAILHHCETSHIGQEVMYSCLPDFRDGKSEMDEVPENERESADHGNIFDRIHNLMQSNDSNSSNQHYLKTSADADSTTGVPSDKLAKSDNSSTEAKKISEASDTAVEEPDDDEGMDIQIVEVVSLKNQPESCLGRLWNVQEICQKSLIAFVSSEASDTAVEEPDDAEGMDIQIVEVVSLRNQPDMAVPPVPVAEFSVSGVGSIAPQTELKIPTFIHRDVPPQPQVSAVNQMKSAQPVKDYNVPKKSSGRLGNTFKCEKCNFHAPLLSAMVTHLRNVHRDIPRLFQCPYCRDLEAETEAKIHHHIRLFHPTDNPYPPVDLSEPAKSNLKTLSIPLPENRFTDNNLVEKDIYMYMCLKCKTHMPTLETIYDHLEAEHIEVFVYVCPFCKTFKSKDENRMNEHIVIAHQRSLDELPLSLAIDGNQFVRVPSLIKEKNKNANKSHSQEQQTAKGVLSTPSPAQTPSPSPNVATENPEAFEIFNLEPIAPRPAPQCQQLPFQQLVQQVRPNTSNTLVYRPTTPHVPNSSQSQQVMSMPVNGNVRVGIPNIQPNLPTVQRQTLQQLVRLGAPVQTGMAQLQNLQPLFRVAVPGQPPTTSMQQALQSPRGLSVGQVSPGVQHINLQQLPLPTPSPQQINANCSMPMFHAISLVHSNFQAIPFFRKGKLSKFENY